MTDATERQDVIRLPRPWERDAFVPFLESADLAEWAVGPMGSKEEDAMAPATGWSDKDERQYEHVRQSSKARGKSTRRATEIAARTVNKQRRREGRTPNKTTQGTGNPNRPLEERTVDELRNIASDLAIAGRSGMRKRELVEAIRGRR